MITKNYRNFFLWIGAVALLAATVCYFTPSAPVRPNVSPSHVAARGSRTAVSQAQAAPTANAEQKPANQPSADSPLAPAAPQALAEPDIKSMTYPKLKQFLDQNPVPVKSIVFEVGSLKITVKRDNGSEFNVILPDADAKVELRKKAEELKIDYDTRPAPAPAIAVENSSPSMFGGFMSMFLPLIVVMLIGTVLSVLVQRWMQGRAAGGGGGFSNFGKSRAKDVKELGDRAEKVTFNDVAGCDEAVAEMRRTVKALIDRGIYADFDGELPSGILLLGPPGTGKTLLAKAVAGECDGTMKALAGSDFVEMLVGVGASRVRDEFALARKTVDETGKPYIIFIDEFDAIGVKRGASVNRNSEQENTLNQLLVEMDGVHTNRGILVIAATNRADMLDEALLRPGRFDSHVSVDLPDIHGREKIFVIHTRKKRLAKGVSPALLAQRTFGYSGAEIKGACNRAAIVAAERWVENEKALKAKGKTAAQVAAMLPKEIELHDFDEGIDFVRLGGAKTGSQARMSQDEKENTSYHEGGHALVAAVLKGADPVVKITIVRRARALGYVQYMPETDRISFSDEQAIARIICAMAGRAAQEVYLNRVDTGASNDFEQASDMAYRMVTKWGMSRLGRISVGERGPGIASHGNGGHMPYGDLLANEIDAEWRRITEACYQIARYIVETEKVRMEALVKELLAEEVILSPRWKEFLLENPSAVDLEKVKFNPAAPAVEGVQS